MKNRIVGLFLCFAMIVSAASLLGAQDVELPDAVPDGVPPEGSGPPDGVPPDRPDEGAGQSNVTSRHLLLPPADAANQEANGDFWLKANPVRNAITVCVRGLEPGASYDVTITNGQSELLGTITTQPAATGGDGGGAAPGTGKLRLDTNRGDSLPLGAAGVGELVGNVIAVTDAGGGVVLATEIADLGRHHPDGPDDTGDSGDTATGAIVAGLLGEPAVDFAVPGPHDATFLRGDTNMDSRVNIADPINTLGILFGGESFPYCSDAADSNDDGDVDISDAADDAHGSLRPGVAAGADGGRGLRPHSGLALLRPESRAQRLTP